MRTTIIALLLVASVLAQDINDIRDLFESWKLENGKEYETYEDEEERFGVFSRNYMYVKAWNEAGNTAVLALNQFADLTSEEFGAMYTGAKPVSQSIVEANIAEFDDEGSYPSDWDWRAKGAVTPIKNQGQCGGCWAFAAVAATEGLYEINGNALTSFSEAQVIDCDNKDGNQGCGGGYPYLAYKYIATNGLETEQDYPFNGGSAKCTYNASLAIKTGVTGGAYVTPKNAADLYTAVFTQPINILVEADQSVFQLYSSGTITTGCGVALDHAITAVGYTADYFIVKNSWGTTWGNEGYVYISSSTQYNKGLGACGIFAQPQFPTGLTN